MQHFHHSVRPSGRPDFSFEPQVKSTKRTEESGISQRCIARPNSCKGRGPCHVVMLSIRPSVLVFGLLAAEMLFGVLFACLCWFSHLLADDLPLIRLVLFDGSKQSRAFILGKFSVMHVLVPVLLDAAFRPVRESFGNLCPAVAGIAHLLETLLFRWSPWRVRPPFFRGWCCW